MALQNSRNSSMADDDEKRLIEVLNLTKFKTPSKDASSMGPDVSLSSIRCIDLTILEDINWCDFSRFFCFPKSDGISRRFYHDCQSFLQQLC